jgi:hypothetical protein
LHQSRIRAVVWALTAAALLYSGVHFFRSGIVFPLDAPNLGKFEEQGVALRNFIRTGEARFDNPAQYGPVFMLVVHPLLLRTHSDQQLANWLYGIQIVCLALAFLITCATLKRLARDSEWLLVVAWLAILWLNFAPVYMTMVVKSVESWEVMLLALALYAYVRNWFWMMGFALATAALVKVLPLIFFYYLLLTNRRAFARALVALVIILAIGHAMYGPQMGSRYMPRLARSVIGSSSYGLMWHENLSLKGAAAKLFGRLIPGPSPYMLTMTTSEQQAASIVGDIAVFGTMALLTAVLLRSRVHSVSARIWEWSLVSVVMLIVSPNTTFEYATLVLGAISYAIVRLRGIEPYLEPHRRTWIYLGASMFFLGVLLPRQVLNTLTFVEALSRRSGYTHLTPSEAYQYYCFPLLGLILLTAALWRLRPVAPARASIAR